MLESKRVLSIKKICLLDPDPVSLFNVPSMYRTNSPVISWSPPILGEADDYILTFAPARTNNGLTDTTNDTKLTANLEFGEKYSIEIIAVFRQLNSTAIFATTVIGNQLF